MKKIGISEDRRSVIVELANEEFLAFEQLVMAWQGGDVSMLRMAELGLGSRLGETDIAPALEAIRRYALVHAEINRLKVLVGELEQIGLTAEKVKRRDQEK